jgi:sugar/nucleoside kinase (ribokinase family)
MTSPRVLFAGRATLDVVYALDQFPAQDTKVFARRMWPAPGGPATNAAITHALLGGKAVLMSAVGGGSWAGFVREEVETLGIDLVDLGDGTAYEAPLTTVLVNTSEGTRTVVNPPPSEVALPRVEGWHPGWGEMPRIALADGFHLPEILPLLAACREGDALLCLDGGSWKPGTEELAGLLTVAICSERFRVPERQADPEATMAWFVEMGVPNVAVTRGGKSILGWDRGRRFEIAVEKIDGADTLGAGDVLHGAFCYEFARGSDFEAALAFASRVATSSCRGMGIRSWMNSF